MSWEEVYDRLRKIEGDLGWAVYGVPRGGAVVAGLTGQAVDSPEKATAIVDDIIDSGRTRDKWQAAHSERPFRALVDKTGPDADLGWVVFPWEESAERDAEDTIVRMLEFIGEDPRREGLRETPARVVRSWAELFAGYGQDPAAIMKVFEDGACNEMVVLRDIDFYSTCEHHLLPFYGRAHVAYIPNGKVIGLSKIARLVEIYARRLQIQEKMTGEVADAMCDYLDPKGVAVVVEGRHLCMCSRGIQKLNGIMTTSALRGSFTEPQVRAEFQALIHGRDSSW